MLSRLWYSVVLVVEVWKYVIWQTEIRTQKAKVEVMDG